MQVDVEDSRVDARRRARDVERIRHAAGRAEHCGAQPFQPVPEVVHDEVVVFHHKYVAAG
ncbi:hypothetical protein IFDJLNFL_4310 [Methylobacterium dankookense]|uniref:Uncharacterized protein n=1 Tax=Methylobacterium dankookense TaxID=560405 RepID=A0ABQ4RM78_9HYPH|nr:hypothetical protein IFDJLNFL_4310 [Methylobacterium dankookense]